MGEVERFEEENVGQVGPLSDGHWVRYSDYEKARREGAEEERARLGVTGEQEVEFLRNNREQLKARVEKLIAERDQALAKGAEEERERLREAFSDEEVLSDILGDDAPAFVRERLRKAALDTPAPSEPEKHHPDCSSHTTRWCDCKGEPREVAGFGPGEEPQ